MPSSPVVESEFRVERTFSTISGARDRAQEQLGMGNDGEGWLQRGVGDRIRKRNTSQDSVCLLTSGSGFVACGQLISSPVLRLFSENGKRDIYLDKHMIRLTNWGRGRARYIGKEVGNHKVQNGKICHLEKSGLENVQIESEPRSHRSAMADEGGINTQPISTVRMEITTYEEERVGMSG